MLGLNPAATAWLQLQMPEHARFRTACAKPANAQRDRLSIIVRANARTAGDAFTLGSGSMLRASGIGLRSACIAGSADIAGAAG